MISAIYQLMCGSIAALAIRGLFVAEGKKQEKVVMAVILVPLLLRLLLIK